MPGYSVIVPTEDVASTCLVDEPIWPAMCTMPKSQVRCTQAATAQVFCVPFAEEDWCQVTVSLYPRSMLHQVARWMSRSGRRCATSRSALCKCTWLRSVLQFACCACYAGHTGKSDLMRSYYHDLVQELQTSQALLFRDETCGGITREPVNFQLSSLNNL